MRCLIVVLNYRTSDLAIDCLSSLEPEVTALPGVRVVVVDNGSQDGSAERIRQAITESGWSDWVETLALAENGGYSIGNNAAIRPALDAAHPLDFVMLLNSDTQIYPGAVSVLLGFLEKNPEVGIVSSQVEDPDGTPHSSTYRFSTILTEFVSGLRLGVVSRVLFRGVIAPPIPGEACEFDWVAGCSMMIRKEVFDSVGLLDEDYFMYYEDMDFCLAARRAGWTIWCEPESRVLHYRGASSGITSYRPRPMRRPTYYFDSRRRYFVKNYGLFTAALADLAWITGFGLWRIRRLIQRKPDTDPPKMLSDSIWNSVFFKGGGV